MTLRFINDVAIPITMIIAILTGDIIAPEVVPATAPVLVANCARLAPYVGRLAAAIGVEEIYRRVTTFFSEKDGGGSREPFQTPHSQGPYTKPGGQKLSEGFKQNLNKLDNLRETIVYEIYRVRDGLTMKFGETAAGYFKSEGMKGILKRPYRQIMQAAKRGQGQLDYREVAKFSTKKEAKIYESKLIDQARMKDSGALPMNKGRH